MEPKVNKKELSPDAWCKAFLAYSHIYLKSYPNEAQNMIKYMFGIIELMGEKADWRLYDKKFRMEKEETKIGWDAFHYVLYAKAHASPLKREQTFLGQPLQQGQYQSKGNFPVGSCHAYHTPGKYCNIGAACKYTHQCLRCGGKHPVYRHDDYRRFDNRDRYDIRDRYANRYDARDRRPRDTRPRDRMDQDKAKEPKPSSSHSH